MAGRQAKIRAANPDRDPAKPCVYVGMTGLDPQERFKNHKRGSMSLFSPVFTPAEKTDRLQYS